MRALRRTGMEASCGMWCIDGREMDFICQPKEGSRGGGLSITVGLAEFSSGVDAWWRESSWRQSISWKRVVT